MIRRLNVLSFAATKQLTSVAADVIYLIYRHAHTGTTPVLF